MAVKYAECHLRLTPRLDSEPIRTRVAEANLEFRFDAPVSASALGGDEITLDFRPEDAQLLFKLLAQLKAGEGDPNEILAAIKEIAYEGRNPAAEHGEDQRGSSHVAPHGGR